MLSSHQENVRSYFIFFLFAVLANALVYFFVSQEYTIYFWDFNTFWQKYELIGDTLKINPVLAIKQLRRSLRDDIYNDLPVYFLLPFRMLFGWGRLSYNFAILNLFALPAIWLGRSFYQKYSPPSVLGLFSLFSFPFLWDPLFYGYLDIGGLICAYAVLHLYFNRAWSEQNKRRLLAISVLLSGMTLFRRWYLFWMISFLAIAFLDITRQTLGKKNFYSWFLGIIKLASVASLAATMYCALTWPLPVRMFAGSNSETLSAYQFNQSFLGTFLQTMAHFGLFYGGLTLAGFILTVYSPKTRVLAAFLAAQLVLIYVLFNRIQDFDVHHYYLLFPSALFFIRSSVLKFQKIVFARVSYVAASFLCFACVFVPSVSDSAKSLEPFTPSARHYPMVRHDLEEMKKLAQTLASLATDDSDRIYVIASSDILNSDILKTTEKTLGLERKIQDKILWTHSVDKFEKFPQHFFAAKFLVVAVPTQYHLRPEDQRVVGIPAEQILSGQGLGAFYKKLPDEFLLDNQTRVFLFQKQTEPTAEAIQEFLALFNPYYPEWASKSSYRPT